jgi:hypothetical protein
MQSTIFRLIIISTFLQTSLNLHAQKDIIISDTLLTNSERMPVKMGVQWMGKMWKFHFGDYTIVSSKMGWTTSSSKSNLFNTKTESKTREKFSFIMTGKSNDSAIVNAANNLEIQSIQEIEILPHVYAGNNEVIKQSHNFSAFITINNDSAFTWALLMNVIRTSMNENNYDALLTDGQRKIMISPTTSNRNGTDTRKIPALGYEFFENSNSIGAVQYYGGGMLGMNKNIIWISKNLDDKTKLLLAAAMTAILQIKVNSNQAEL